MGPVVRPRGGPEFAGITLKAILSLDFFPHLVALLTMLEPIKDGEVLIKISVSLLPKSQGEGMDLNSWRMTFIVAVHIVF